MRRRRVYDPERSKPNNVFDPAPVPRQISLEWTPEGGRSSGDDMAQDHIETLRKLLAEKRGVLLPGAANALSARIIETVPGDKAYRPLDAGGCPLVEAARKDSSQTK